MLRFLADANVGRLARWLRVLGFDAAYEPRLADPLIVARALAEDRVLLTRDDAMVRRRVVAGGRVRSVLLEDDRVSEQLRQVVRELELQSGLLGKRALTRCLECNVALEPREKGQVLDRLPPHVRATHDRFSQCPSCQRVYWPGTHWDRMRRRIATL